MLISMSLAHGAKAPRIFSTIMYTWLSEGYEAAKAKLEVQHVPQGTEMYGLIQDVSKMTHCTMFPV